MRFLPARRRLPSVLGLLTSCALWGCSSDAPPVESTNGGAAGSGAVNNAGKAGKTAAGGENSAGTAANGGSTSTGGVTTSGGTLGAAATGSGGTAASGAPTTGNGGFTSAGAGGVASAGGSTAGGAGGSTSTGCGKAPTIPSSMYNNGQRISITAANMQREYILSVPASYDNTKPYKLVIAYHQLNGDHNEMYRNQYYHLLPLSNDTTIFVAPNGQKDGKNCSSASNCGWPNSNGSDLALADAVVAQIKENFCVDTNRIFATGWSYGGSMSYKTACERPLGSESGYIRGIAIYSAAQLSGNCTPSKAVAFYGSHGDNDSVLQYDGGVGLARNFATANGCTWMTPTKVTSGNHMCTNVAGCAPEHPTQFCAFDGDHTPDPKDPNQQNSWQYQVVWDFLSKL